MTKNERGKLYWIVENLLEATYTGNFAIAEISSTIRRLIDLNPQLKAELPMDLPEELYNFAVEWGMYND